MRKQNTQEDLMRHYKSHYLDNHKELPDDVQALKDIIYVSNVNLTRVMPRHIVIMTNKNILIRFITS